MSTEEDLAEAFAQAFLDACHEGELREAKEVIASGRLAAKNLEEGLDLATARASAKVYADIVTALFDAGAHITEDAVESLPGENGQQPSVVRQYLDHGMDPNAKQEYYP
ncbi:hypothetical protein BKA61DRAFT_581779 [Leptodontidium sp. MPI-SDFR-AT-0119]|nr:hypothetical protein BKA61DRAFT_581779 [Leptodontidium sp. MPI-SDFR-AT-0119]